MSTDERNLNYEALAGRRLTEGPWDVNSTELAREHREINGSIIRTRFPPEPNGYLHIGHALSMNMNFSLAFDRLGVPPGKDRRTIFRYDDTNPDVESKEYIDAGIRDLKWLGWEPERITYSSDNFNILYEFAIKLIEKGLAYCCDMTEEEVKAQRELALNRVKARNTPGKDPDKEHPIPSSDVLPGRNRNTSVERNLEIFRKMKAGAYEKGGWTLRLKMDFDSPNPNMYDLVAYRIKNKPHPAVHPADGGEGWCIYPSYDFTHGICDSLERIDYSICTLEFESRREPYYWILWALDLYRPNVYEMARLNLEYTVLSKRRLLKLVSKGYVRGWDDPRMPTISGLRRRGYTKDIINKFCNDLGVSRAANVIEYKKLVNVARAELNRTSRCAMACLEPIKVVISNWGDGCGNGCHTSSYSSHDDPMVLNVPNCHANDSMGSHHITLTNPFFIDGSDFRLEDSVGYYGLAPNKAVGLKYHGGNLVCDKVVLDSSGGKAVELVCHLDTSTDRPKPKCHISWAPANSITAEVRVYNHLFTTAVPSPSDNWEEEINSKSEEVYPRALVDPSVAEVVDFRNIDKWSSATAFHFERMGYFVVDRDTTFDPLCGSGRLVFNRTYGSRCRKRHFL